MEEIFVRKNEDKLRWDNQVCEKAELKDISSSKVKNYLKKAKLKYDSLENSMEKLDLLKNGKLLNAAVIMFGKDPGKFFSNAKLRCAVFGGTNTAYTVDMHDFDGDLFSLIDHAEKYILDHINIGMKLDGMRRLDVPEIDREAFREAIINAFCHRDYNKYDEVQVAIFKDRVEIRSPGLLYQDLTIDRIIKENISRRRNMLIADLFHRIHYIEKWGRGIGLILSKEPDTKFREVVGQFYTVFKRKDVIGEATTQKTVEKTVEKILELIRDNPRITQKQLMEKTRLTRRGVEWNLQKLRKEGKIKRIGPDKGGYWEVGWNF